MLSNLTYYEHGFNAFFEHGFNEYIIKQRIKRIERITSAREDFIRIERIVAARKSAQSETNWEKSV